MIEGHSPSLRAVLDAVKLGAERLLGTLDDNPRATTSELEGVPISIECFTSALADQVRVRLDFARLNEANFRCRLRVIRDARELSGWVSPWYLDANGNECAHTDEGARAIEVVRADGSANPSPSSHAEQVARIADSMKTGGAGPILIGGYRPFGRDVVVVVDGNHRLRAAVQSGHPLHLVALVLHGPDDPAILSDLTAA